MELRHLRHFIAVAERAASATLLSGGCTQAAKAFLESANGRDLELEVGVKLLDRKARGIALTKAGRVFLDHSAWR